MPELSVVGQKIMEIEGVDGCLIATNEARIALSENVENPVELAASLALCMVHSEGLKQVVGMTKLRHVTIILDNSREALVLPVNKYIIAIMTDGNTPSDTVMRDFRKIFAPAPNRQSQAS